MPDDNTTESPYVGQNVTTTGVVTAVNFEGFYIQNGTGAWSGVYVFTEVSPTVAPGDVVTVSAPVSNYFGVTQLDASATDASYSVTGSDTVPAPTELATGTVSQEAYEGVLVRVENVTVTATPGEFGEWDVSDGSGGVAVDDVDTGDSTTPNQVGATIDALVGPVFFGFEEFKIQPKQVVNLTAPPAGDEPTLVNGTELTILSYNDLQTAMSNPNTMGHLAGVLDSREAAHENPTIVVGGGDQVSPNSLSPVSNWTVPIDVLNVMDPAAEVVGNHDLDFGFGAVSNYSAESQFPWLVANIEQEGSGANIPGTQDYTIVERGNLSIGIFGLVDDAVKSKTAVDFDEEGYVVDDYLSTGQDIASTLKNEENVDVVIALAHIGIPESEQLAQQSSAVDVIVTGDDELTYPPQVISDTMIVEAAGNAEYVGELNITVNATEVAFNDNSRLIPVAASSDMDSLPNSSTVYTTIADARGTYLSQVAGVTTVPLDSTTFNYQDETRWGNLITDAFVEYTAGTIGITNAGGIRGGFVIPPGNVTYDDVYTSLPFGNTLVTKSLTGEQLTEFLASQAGDLTGQFGAEAAIQVSGVQYEFIDRPGVSADVPQVWVDGEPVDMDATYNVTVNSFMAGWTFGDRYGWNMSDRPTVDINTTLYGTAAVNYIEANSPVSPSDENRIRRVTRMVGSPTVTHSSDGVTLEYSVPPAITQVNASTVVLTNASGGELTAESASLAGGTLSVTFDTGAYHSFIDMSTDVELYGNYVDTQYNDQRVAFNNSILNGDVPMTMEQPPTIGVGTGDDHIDAPMGMTTEIPVVVTNSDSGVGAYEITLSVTNASAIDVTDITVGGDASLSEVDVSDDGTTIELEVALADTSDTGTVTLATLSVEGTSFPNTSTISVTEAAVYTEDGDPMTVNIADGREVVVSPPDITGNGLAMKDPDDDGEYEDVNGDGTVDVVDAHALWTHRDDPVIESITSALDFNDDGVVDVGDVQALFANKAEA